MRFLNHGSGNNRTVLKHVFQIYQVTVMLLLCKVIRIMKMNNAGLVRIHYLFWQQNTIG